LCSNFRLSLRCPPAGKKRQRVHAIKADYNREVQYLLRDGRSSDLDALWRIDQACFPPGISYSRLELAVYMRRPGSFTLVAEQPRTRTKSFGDQPGTILGFLVSQTEANKTGHIVTIDVVGNARRAGIGSKLLAAAEERLRAAQIESVYLETMISNLGAVEFYQRHSYELVRTEERYYPNGADAFVFAKELLSAPSGQ
jgi:ribosomal-protein-alanine N-acetyltransferase